jgi:ubiquitin C-terminal hydrolase
VWTVEEALAAYCAPEPLESFRDAKGVTTAATKSLHVARAPRVLLIHLKNFAFTERGEEKLHKRVQFREHLQLERTVCRDAPRYRLAAVVEHIGPMARMGHYVAFARDASTGGWLRFDDTVVHSTSLNAVLARPAFILCYEQE